ncbi:4'-phosphopantetheinyl transferase superfamily protein [Micrococcus sp.]|uniref:4'-phosphopantetheinyl transferase superfamily protein n=1 Tax=Micrococcus sp. TaxID=1271 RepID=UPI0026DAC460|nr:4'-phosphopantetheinyl transferase superfamily protein [Micrococcus sp.]MDO4240137.1 4'-phosphopantetheinyl transferase superfamily protein [Micrococcus sp.]
MTARPADALPGVWGLTTAVPAPAGAAAAASGSVPRAEADRRLLIRVREALAGVWGVDPGPLGLARRCPACGSEVHGAPRLTGLPAGRRALVSLTGVADDDGTRLRVAAWWTPGAETERETRRRPGRRGDAFLAGAAAAGRAWGLGLDLERRDASAFAGPDGLGDVGLSAGERAWVAGLPPADRPAARVRLWTRKEALVKAAGTGFTGDPADVSARAPGPGAAVDLDARVLRAAGLPPGVCGALALRGPAR